MPSPTAPTNDEIVLVGVLKNTRDRQLLLSEHWYRIPVAQAPRRPFHYLAFYQPAVFGRQGKCIRYYARVIRCRTDQRRRLLPAETWHPRARHPYLQFCVGAVKKLPRPIKNRSRRRIAFGFTTLRRLQTAGDILQLYNVAPTEQLVGRAMQRLHITAQTEYGISHGPHRYRLDFAVFCRHGAIAIECDNTKAHAGIHQQRQDRRKNRFLQRQGWVVIRLSEPDLLADLPGCLKKIKQTIKRLGGQRAGS